jgi:hypothetical protein
MKTGHNLGTVRFFTTQNCPFSSGRGDLNPGPLGPKPSALTGLSYAPKFLKETLYMSPSKRIEHLSRTNPKLQP